MTIRFLPILLMKSIRAGLSGAMAAPRRPVESASTFTAFEEPSKTNTATASEGMALRTLQPWGNCERDSPFPGA